MDEQEEPEPRLPDEEDVAVYDLITQHVEQFRRHRATMSLRDVEQAEKSFKEVRQGIVRRVPPEQRLAGLTPKEIAAVLPPEVIEIVARKLAP